MRAAVITRYGSPDVIEVREAPTPAPGPGEVLIRAHAAAVGRTDCGELRAHPFFARAFYGWRRPRRTIFGLDFAGVVETVGADVGSAKLGDRVFGMCPSRRNGAQAEFVCDPERTIATMPAGLPFAQAVVCEGAFYAHAVLTRIGLKAGHKLLVYGGSGAVGTALVQLANAAGALVTAMVPTEHVGLARSLGADRVLDYATGDFTRIGETFDAVAGAVGKTSFFRCRKLLTPGGIFVATDLGPWGQNAVLAGWLAIFRRNRVAIPVPGRIGAFPSLLKIHMEAGRFRAVIDRSYPLAAIADAYRFVEAGQKAGIVVIDVFSAGDPRSGATDLPRKVE